MDKKLIGEMYANAWLNRLLSPVSNVETDLALMHKESLSPEYINDLALGFYEGPIHVVRTENELIDAVSELSKEDVLGFDTETRPVFRKGYISPIALVQLAGAKNAYLIQLNCVPFGEILASLLANPSIIKAGVAINEDMNGLMRLHQFSPAGVADLGAMAQSIGIKTIGLRNMTANLLGFRISKNAQCSNWERDKLEPRQIRYAATDAWLGRELYLRLLSLGCKPVVQHKYSRNAQ